MTKLIKNIHSWIEISRSLAECNTPIQISYGNERYDCLWKLYCRLLLKRQLLTRSCVWQFLRKAELDHKCFPDNFMGISEQQNFMNISGQLPLLLGLCLLVCFFLLEKRLAWFWISCHRNFNNYCCWLRTCFCLLGLRC